VKRSFAIQGWLLFALLFTAGSLLLFDARLPRTEEVSSRPAFTLPVDPARLQRATVSAQTPRQGTLAIPFEADAIERTRQYRCVLRPQHAVANCQVQVLAEGDHHFSFSHVYRCASITPEGFAFTVPLRGDAAYWRTRGHRAAWTAWERSGLRRLEVKLFCTKPVPGTVLELRYREEQETDAESRLVWCRAPDGPLPLGRRFELGFDLDGWSGNPFRCAELPVTMEVASPDGKTWRIRPFLTQDFEENNQVAGERIQPSGPKHFAARFRPVVCGMHTYRLLARGADGRSRELGAGRFEVAAGEPPPFLRVSTRAPHFFERADGRFVYLVGWNFPYPVDHPYDEEYVPYLPAQNSLAFTRKMIDDLADAGGNFFRLWLSDWWNGLEWSRNVDNYSGLGRYNLKHAWLNDRVLERCEQRGIYVQLETMNHVRLCQDYGWPQNPYSVRNGGFLRRPQEFFVNPRVLPWSENRLDYLLARYADSPAIHSWNLMSEPDQVAGRVWPQAKERIVSQLTYLQREDPYGHVVANHICLSDRDVDFFRQDAVQFVNCNAYPGLAGLSVDQIPAIRDFSERYSGHGRPMIVAECAGHWGGDPAFKMRRDTIGALWAGIASDLAGTPLSWWWNFNYGEDLGRSYRVAADFMQGEDLIAASGDGGWSNRAVEVASSAGNLRALLVGSRTRRFLFAYNFDTLCRTRQIPSRCEGCRIRFNGMQPGDYRAEYWDLQQGRTALRQPLAVAADGSAVLELPPFAEGWAIKIGRAGSNDAAAASLAWHLAPPPPSAMAVQPVGRGTEAADWSWRIEPLVESLSPLARMRALIEVRLALPEVCRGLYPRVTDAAGAAIPFAWQPLAGGAGWQVRVPAASVNGPLTVTATSHAPAHALAIDEEAFGLGLTVAPGRSNWMDTRAAFDATYARLTNRMQTRVSVIDQVENPLGRSERFLAVYQGPLLVPADGVYVFASNSDDANFVALDGQEIVAWGGGHDMEVPASPGANRWLHRGARMLTRGVHWIEYFHQQRGGACLARLGWQPPAAVFGANAACAQPFRGGETPRMEVVPAWVLDGRIPCRVTVQCRGETLAALDSCLGLELRRPRQRLAAVALARPGGESVFRFFADEGPQWIDAGRGAVPVWAWNADARAFSLEWENCVGAQRKPAVKVLLYDIAMPLSVRFDGRPAGERRLARRVWEAWTIPVAPERPKTFTVCLGSIPLVNGKLDDGGAALSGPSGGKP